MTNAADAPSEITVAGEVRSIIFRDPGSGFTVAAVVCDEGEIRVTGYLATVRPVPTTFFMGTGFPILSMAVSFRLGRWKRLCLLKKKGLSAIWPAG